MSRLGSSTRTFLVALATSWAITACEDPLAPGPVRHYTAITTGLNHSCAVAEDGSAWCWGSNEDGQLGIGSRVDQFTPARVSGGLSFEEITAGDSHTCALTGEGRAYCWGWNAYYQLGVISASDLTVPQPVETDERFTQISAGAHHTCGVTTDERVFCWGYNRWGQNGNGLTVTTVPAFPISVDFEARSVSAGGHHTCALDGAGIAWCWGRNDFHQLAIGSDRVFSPDPLPVQTGLRFASIDAGSRHTCGVAGGATYCWGSNEHGEIGDGVRYKPDLPGPTSPVRVALLQNVSAVSAGTGMTCAIAASQGTNCWGLGTEGQLGNGNTMSQNFPQSVRLIAKTNLRFTAIAAGGATHTCGLIDGSAYCWGSGPSGQLGAGSSTFSVLPQRVADGG